jgi:hypothetical protein
MREKIISKFFSFAVFKTQGISFAKYRNWISLMRNYKDSEDCSVKEFKCKKTWEGGG